MGTIIGSAPLGVQHEAKTTAYVILTTDAGKVFSNIGATALVPFTLPTADVGAGPFTFLVLDADGIEITAAGADTIQIYDQISAPVGVANSTDTGSTLRLICVETGKWIAESGIGIWTVT